MRKYLFCLVFLLAGCGGDGGDGFAASGGQSTLHVPEIRALALSPDTANYMVGDGNINITALITFRDVGLDIQTLWVRMPDGTSIEFSESLATETGTFSEEFVMSTAQAGAFNVEFWLVDKAGAISAHRTAEFKVVGAPGADWTSRLSGLPYGLNDVTWDGSIFIAVGQGGAVLTSPDGIDWAEKDSATVADLYRIATDGQNIIAVGNEILLRSTDKGETWVTKSEPGLSYATVAFNSPQVVVGGMVLGLAGPFIEISPDGGATWEMVTIFGQSMVPFIADLIFADGLFVATTPEFFLSQTTVTLSSDGRSWNNIPVLDENLSLNTIVHDGSRFVAAGEYSTVLTSFDAVNWTEVQTPVEDVEYMSSAWSGSELVLAGGSSNPRFAYPVGLSSTDGGLTWEAFDIDGFYQSHGLAFGNGRLVSVGRSSPGSGEGAIYTRD